MSNYEIFWKKSAVKELKSLPKNVASKIISIIDKLQDEPRPSGVKKIEKLKHHFRLRMNEYRIIYSIEDNKLIIEIIRIGHRKDVYRGI
ncbi:MAG: hypothetical protein A2X64_10810 [Ignavibacteria bacterium GWF2_33_9]|nr:MAG: hypothetical protein A2X64_10810 [Ignavibacteria bacterium GWF2_33_9]